MNNNLESFLQKIQGTWILQKTTHYIHNYNLDIYISENKISIQKKLNNNNQISQLYHLKNIDLKTNRETFHMFTVNHKNISLKTINDNIAHDVQICLYSDKHINRVFIYKNICYDEQNYIITPNFLLSIGIIKRNNCYIAVTFTSYIKKIID